MACTRTFADRPGTKATLENTPLPPDRGRHGKGDTLCHTGLKRGKGDTLHNTGLKPSWDKQQDYVLTLRL